MHFLKDLSACDYSWEEFASLLQVSSLPWSTCNDTDRAAVFEFDFVAVVIPVALSIEGFDSNIIDLDDPFDEL